jgi:hypothetical protein
MKGAGDRSAGVLFFGRSDGGAVRRTAGPSGIDGGPAVFGCRFGSSFYREEKLWENDPTFRS